MELVSVFFVFFILIVDVINTCWRWWGFDVGILGDAFHGGVVVEVCIGDDVVWSWVEFLGFGAFFNLYDEVGRLFSRVLILLPFLHRRWGHNSWWESWFHCELERWLLEIS